MPTQWEEIITNNALVFIDDIRLTEQLQTDPALFFRRMSLYVSNALPLLSRPPELLTFLENNLIYPNYDETEWISTVESLTNPTTIATEKIGFEMCSCVLRSENTVGEIILTPYENISYDSETGEITFPIQESEGLDYEIDFYTDGQFADELTATQKRLLGLAIACVWDERFSRNWLNIQMKIKDDSFETVNESSYINAVQNRLSTNRALFYAELRKYEQDNAYNNKVPSVYRIKNLI